MYIMTLMVLSYNFLPMYWCLAPMVLTPSTNGAEPYTHCNLSPRKKQFTY